MTGFRGAAEDYLAMRRSLGFELRRQGQVLLQFADHLDAANVEVITNSVALAWAVDGPRTTPAWAGSRLTVVRGFARYMSAFDPRTEVPPVNVLPVSSYPRVAPYLFSPAEIDALMAEARHSRFRLAAVTYETLLGLLAVTGLRIGEALSLDRCDVDLGVGLLVVRQGKNRKARQLPLHPSTVEALARYVRRRDELCRQPQSPSFFVSLTGSRLHYRSACNQFEELRRRTGLDRRARSRLPRLHDLRHTFVLTNLLKWYAEGVDVSARLPLLSAYLGHSEPSSSYWYFEAAPELLALAAERREATGRNRP